MMQALNALSHQPALRGVLALVLIVASSVAHVRSSTAQAATPVATPGTSVPWWQDAVCYEVFVRSFVDSDGDGIGDLPGLTSRLDYLNDGDPFTATDLGVTCIWLMPVSEASSYHGYDTIDYRTIESDYGANEDFIAFVTEANARGIQIITDLVLNHVSIEHTWFQEALANPTSPYREYFVFSATDPAYPGSFGQNVWFPTPGGDAFYYATFGEGLPDLNYRNPAVTREAEDIARFWIEEMGVAGFRLDAIKHLIENGQEQENTDETHAWLRTFGAFLTGVRPDVYAVGEIFNASAFMLSAYLPDQLTAYFQFEFGPQILQATESGVGGSLSYTITDSLSQIPDQRFAPFLTNHDQTRSMTLLQGNIERAKLAATALLTLPGLPFIYYGEEIGMTGNKPDPRLRTPMQWTAASTGFTSGTPWEPFQNDLTTVNVAAQETDPESLLQHYKRLIQLHAASPALSRGDCLVLDSPSQITAFLRQSEDRAVLTVLNFGDEALSNPELSIDATGLAPGSYDLVSLFGSGSGASLIVGTDGAIESYTGLLEIDPLSGSVFDLVSSPA
jgi:glycosidase